MFEDLVTELTGHRFLDAVQRLKVPPVDSLHHHSVTNRALDLGAAAGGGVAAAAVAAAAAAPGARGVWSCR